MFQLTKKEYEDLKCQIGISSLLVHGERRTLPYVFTEMGVETLASLLYSDVAINMSKKIIRSFVSMQHYLIENKDIYLSLNNKLANHDDKVNYLFSKFDKKDIYHCGASINYDGIKTFSVNKLEDEIIIKTLINNIMTII